MSPSTLSPRRQRALAARLEQQRLADLAAGVHEPYLSLTQGGAGHGSPAGSDWIVVARCLTCLTSGPVRSDQDETVAREDMAFHIASAGHWPQVSPDFRLRTARETLADVARKPG